MTSTSHLDSSIHAGTVVPGSAATLIGACLRACTLLLIAAPLAGQNADPPDNRTADDMQNSVETVAPGLLEVRFHNVDLVYALEMLSEQTQENIVLQNGVSGTVSSILRRVTFQEALDAILVSNDLTHEQRGNVIFISKKAVATVQTDLGPLVTHVFRLKFMSAAEAERFLQPLLAEGDSVTRYSDAEEGIKPDSQSAGGLSSAAGELLVVITSPERLESMKTLLAELDEKPRQVLIEATIMRATLSEQNALGIDFNMLGGVDLQVLGATSPAATNLTGLGNIPQSRLDNSSYTIRTDFNDLMPGGGFTFGIIKDHVAAFIRALEQITDVTVMANPKLLALNKQRGELIVGRRDGYLTTTVTQTAAVETVEFLETGTKLIFRPYIMGDDYVRLEVHPEDSNGGLTAANLPFQETTEATTNILMRSGHTILIAGLFRERTQTAKSRVPLISNIPWIGHLFGIDQDQTTREEVIILLTVTILGDSDAEYEAFDQLVEDIERVRVGARRGLMGTGRDKLAQAHYQWALEHRRCGDIDKAETDLRMALHINPRHMDAIHLRERITNERFSYIEGSRMRAFVRQLIRSESGLNPETVYQRPDVTDILNQARIRAAGLQGEEPPDE